MKYTIQDLREAVERSECWSDVCRVLNVTICTYNFKRMQSLCDNNHIEYKQFEQLRNKTFRRNKPYWTHDEVYSKSSEFPRASLRQRVISDNFMPYVCASCGNPGEWMGKPITLEVEHVNGINDDNRQENLKWLCPNCHSQTSTYRNSKNRAPVAQG